VKIEAASMSTVCAYPLLQALSQVTDFRKSRARRHSLVGFGITSLAPTRADAQRLATILRGHWAIENRLHWIRDVDFGEDASRIHTGKAPQTIAIFRNTAIGFLGILGYDSPIEGLRHVAWHSADAVKLVIERPILSTWARVK
jgi:predicted transposase YbfD/YdcC